MAADVPWLGLIVSTVVVKSRRNDLKLTKCTDIFQWSICEAHFQVDHVLAQDRYVRKENPGTDRRLKQRKIWHDCTLSTQAN